MVNVQQERKRLESDSGTYQDLAAVGFNDFLRVNIPRQSRGL